jgi:Cu2+-exporting ATPase
MNKVNVLITDNRNHHRRKTFCRENSSIIRRFFITSIASLNQYSEHPLAQAVVNFAKAKVSLIEVKDFEAISGKESLER